MKIPSGSCLTCKSKKKVKSSIILISNLYAMASTNSLLKASSVDPKMMLCTYTCEIMR